VTSQDIRIALGSVYQPPEDPYPRVLVMRRWPRGIARGAVDQWEPDLGPSIALLSAYQAGEVEWDAFAERYRSEVLARPHLLDWVGRMAAGTGVTLLCGSHPDEECHRGLLADILRERLGGRAGG
jgi:uncharacterized protein YeaO (DUF488 family)